MSASTLLFVQCKIIPSRPNESLIRKQKHVIFSNTNKSWSQKNKQTTKTRLSFLGHTEQHYVSLHDITSMIDRRVALWQSHCVMPCMGIRIFTQFLCNIWFELLTLSWRSESLNSAHAVPSERKWAGRLQGGCWSVFKQLTDAVFCKEKRKAVWEEFTLTDKQSGPMTSFSSNWLNS